MYYRILYHPKVKEDIELLDKRQKKAVAKAIEHRLGNEPEKYGTPLRRSLKGYWKLRVGDIRVVFKVVKKEVHVLAIIHRKTIYERILARI
jgi:mRNA interferase RelE/StbE